MKLRFTAKGCWGYFRARTTKKRGLSVSLPTGAGVGFDMSTRIRVSLWLIAMRYVYSIDMLVACVYEMVFYRHDSLLRECTTFHAGLVFVSSRFRRCGV
uniref:Uncharacterized protein n=1 Tax=Salmonella phage vB_SEnST11_KE22 TaxID=3161173 RepID=A0AAU8GE20_9CAUD